ncbi:MAG: ABC transporter permease [Clostridia bacterium]|nr:ABC transporter permease [Clostridia bacterium]
MIVFFIVLAITASLFVYGACSDARKALDENYIFVASLIPRKEDSLSLRDIGYCVEQTDILSYNVSMSENDGIIVGGEYLRKLPEKTEVENAPLALTDEVGCQLIAVENLYLVYPFFTEECTICEGTGITEKGYMGDRAEAVIPWWFAEKYDISIGDLVTRRYYRDDYKQYIYLKTEVVGIYETSALSPNEEDYPVYIPLSIAEFDYANVVAERKTLTSELVIERADFVLKNRDSFENFFLQAKENGLDFRNADIVFNNSTYDIHMSELDNIHMVAMLVLCTVLVVGVGVLVFFTVYLCHSRKREQTMLLALGMSRHQIYAMMAIELVTIAVVSCFVGICAGYFMADTVCNYVNDSVLANVEISEKIENADQETLSNSVNLLEQEIKLEISIQNTMVSAPALAINDIKTIEENEIGISKHLYYNIGSHITSMLDGGARVPTTVIGITDMNVVKTSVFDDMTDTYEDFICVFVSEDFDMREVQNHRIFLTSYEKDGYVSLIKESVGLGNASTSETTQVIIVGTYEENEYCSGNDMLVCMEDYHRLYSEFSITDESFRFERIGKFMPLSDVREGENLP